MESGADVASCLVDLCRSIRVRVRAALRRGGDLGRAAGRSVGDVQYRIDRLSEEGLVAAVRKHLRPLLPLRLLSEGLPPEGVVVAAGRGAADPLWRVLVDPIDGTRGLMFGKRSAFVLAGAAPERPDARFRHLAAVAMVEIAPPNGGEGSDVLVAVRGGGARGWRESTAVRTGGPPRGRKVADLIAPSSARTLSHGFATFNRFLDGAQDVLGGLAEAFFERALSAAERGSVFEDQYICNAGQMHGLLTGRDRMVVDARPHFRDRRGRPLAAAHPYDVLGALILEEAGCPVTSPDGAPFDPPLDVVSDVAWAAFANGALARRYGPALAAALAETNRRAVAPRLRS